ncbi:MAG: SRPBCC family protein [Tildeniella nuda ZEHNDER 1965/U140]|jgi:ribosome-associated toxin RatA of RatAB toxin-antitoxin module|nr:SRPBCC family protein [Tildeniella nuda ZEHNDER 1965/U140]
MLKLIHISVIAGCFGALSLLPLPLASGSSLFNSTVDQLPTEERVLLRNGQPLITGENGQYTARVLLSTSADTVWSVLTDYSNTPTFMPYVVSSKVITVNGNQKVIEQVDVRQVFFVTARSRIRSAITETAKTRIDFQAIDGDLKSLKGYWLLEPIAPYTGAKANQILLTQVIEVQPKAGTPSRIFYDVFKDSLGESMSAIKRETERRTQ